MARKDLSQVEYRTVASAVAKRYPDLTPEDQQQYVSRILGSVADAINNGGYPAVIVPLADGTIEIDYFTITDNPQWRSVGSHETLSNRQATQGASRDLVWRSWNIPKLDHPATRHRDAEGTWLWSEDRDSR